MKISRMITAEELLSMFHDREPARDDSGLANDALFFAAVGLDRLAEVGIRHDSELAYLVNIIRHLLMEITDGGDVFGKLLWMQPKAKLLHAAHLVLSLGYHLQDMAEDHDRRAPDLNAANDDAQEPAQP